MAKSREPKMKARPFVFTPDSFKLLGSIFYRIKMLVKEGMAEEITPLCEKAQEVCQDYERAAERFLGDTVPMNINEYLGLEPPTEG